MGMEISFTQLECQGKVSEEIGNFMTRRKHISPGIFIPQLSPLFNSLLTSPHNCFDHLQLNWYWVVYIDFATVPNVLWLWCFWASELLGFLYSWVLNFLNSQCYTASEAGWQKHVYKVLPWSHMNLTYSPTHTSLKHLSEALQSPLASLSDIPYQKECTGQ